MSSPGNSQVQLRPLKDNGDLLSDIEASPAGPLNGDEYNAPAPGEHLEGVQMYSVSAALLTAIFLGTLDASILATAIPQITAHFHSTLDIGWYGSIYLMAICAILPTAGMFYSYFSAKYTFMGFLFVFELGSLLSGVAVSSKMLIVGRAIAGLGSAGIYNGGLTIMGEGMKPSTRAWQIGLGTSVATMGSVFGPLIGGALTSRASWRWCFYINLPPGALVVLVLLAIKIPEAKSRRIFPSSFTQRLDVFDLVGFSLFAPACVMLLLALQWGGVTYAWNSARVIGLLCGAAAAFVLFVIHERLQGDRAMIPSTIVRNPVAFFGFWTVFFQFAALMVLTYYLPMWFQVVQDASAVMSGVMLLPTIISQTLFTLVAGAIVSKGGFCAPPAIVGCALTTVGAGLMTTFVPSTSTGKWIGYQILVGAGRGLSIQVPLIATQAVLPAQWVPSGTSFILFGQFFGGSVFTASAQTVFANRLYAALAHYIPHMRNASQIVEAGAVPSAFESLIPASEHHSVIFAYNRALSQTWYLAIGLAGVAILASCGLGFKHIDGKPQEKKVHQNGST